MKFTATLYSVLVAMSPSSRAEWVEINNEASDLQDLLSPSSRAEWVEIISLEAQKS